MLLLRNYAVTTYKGEKGLIQLPVILFLNMSKISICFPRYPGLRIDLGGHSNYFFTNIICV